MMQALPILIPVLLLAAVALLFLLSGLAMVHDNQVGILTKKMGGKKLPQGQIIARNGEVGVQAHTLMPGLYWRMPIIWSIKKDPVTVIGSNQVGVVESIDGEAMPSGRLLGDAVDCNSFQDAAAFLNSGGKKGPQVAILRPGTYRINTKVFTVRVGQLIIVPKNSVGVIVAQDGEPLPSGYIIAPKPKEDGPTHKFFQDGQAFINSHGYRGPQLDTLQPGEYYINPLLFQVNLYEVAEVPPGYVAVLRSNVGKELEEASGAPSEVSASPDLRQPIHESIETPLIPDKDRRGILKDPVAPGKYNLNPIAYSPYLVPTSAVTIDWASEAGRADSRYDSQPKTKAAKEGGTDDKATEFFKFSQLRVTSKDGFQLEVDVRMVIRIRPEHAPFIIARFGSVSNLIEQIVHPLIDSSFRNKAGEEKAITFVQSRAELQQGALTRAREEFQQYSVEAQNLLIAYIQVDQALLDTQTKKEIALQQKEQFKEEALAAEESIAVAEKRARADKQGDVIAAKLSIEIAADRADAARREAEGQRDAIQTKATGEAEAIRQVGEATASAYKAQSEVVGPSRLAILKALQEVASGKVQITPNVLVNGSSQDGQSGSLFTAWLATMLKEDAPKEGESN